MGLQVPLQNAANAAWLGRVFGDHPGANRKYSCWAESQARPAVASRPSLPLGGSSPSQGNAPIVRRPCVPVVCDAHDTARLLCITPDSQGGKTCIRAENGEDLLEVSITTCRQRCAWLVREGCIRNRQHRSGSRSRSFWWAARGRQDEEPAEDCRDWQPHRWVPLTCLDCRGWQQRRVTLRLRRAPGPRSCGTCWGCATRGTPTCWARARPPTGSPLAPPPAPWTSLWSAAGANDPCLPQSYDPQSPRPPWAPLPVAPS